MKIYQRHGSAYLPFVGREEQWQMASVAFLEDGEGEGDLAKSEMMVASSVKLRLRGGGVL